MINDRGQLYCIDFIKNFDAKITSINEKTQLENQKPQSKDYAASEKVGQQLESLEAKEGWEISQDGEDLENKTRKDSKILNRSITSRREKSISQKHKQEDPVTAAQNELSPSPTIQKSLTVQIGTTKSNHLIESSADQSGAGRNQKDLKAQQNR